MGRARRAAEMFIAATGTKRLDERIEGFGLARMFTLRSRIGSLTAAALRLAGAPVVGARGLTRRMPSLVDEPGGRFAPGRPGG